MWRKSRDNNCSDSKSGSSFVKISGAWKKLYDTFSAVVSAITAWRAETSERMSIEHYLMLELYVLKMRRDSLDAMMSSILERGAKARHGALRTTRRLLLYDARQEVHQDDAGG